MGIWRDAFEAGAAEYDRSANVHYVFGAPATAEQIAHLERALSIRVPDAVRSLLSEFNGVWIEYRPGDRSILYLDIDHIVKDVPRYLSDSGNPMPPVLNKVAFVANSNGFGALFAVCLEDFGRFQKGEVVMMANDIGEFETDHPDLMAFVRNGCKLN